jgi:hypothetical protein
VKLTSFHSNLQAGTLARTAAERKMTAERIQDTAEARAVDFELNAQILPQIKQNS